MIFLGIDPGASGAIVALSDGVDKFHTDVLRIVKLDETEADIASALYDLKLDAAEGEGMFAMLEKVGAMPPGLHGRRQGVASSFKFGRNYGVVRGMLVALKIPFDDVLPAKWQGVMSCKTGGDKNISKARAQQLFPQVKVTHAIADALLIAEFCRRVKSGELERATA